MVSEFLKGYGLRGSVGMDRKRKFLTFLIIIISFLRFLSVFTVSNIDLIFDEASYMNIARGLVEGLDFGYIPGEGYSDAYRPPLYPLILALFFSIFGSSELVARSVSAIFGILAVTAMYFLGKKLYNENIGLYSSLILSTTPTYWFYSSKALVEGMLIFLIILFLYVFYSSFENKKYLIPSGILLGLVFLTKYTGVVFAVFFVLFTLAWKREFLRNKYFYLFFVTAFLVISPWIFFNLKVFQTPFGSGSFLFGKNLGTGILNNFDLYYFLAIAIETCLYFPFMLAGFYLMFKKRDKNFLPFLLLFLLFIIPLSFFEVKRSRYITPLLPIFALSAAYSFESLKNIRLKINFGKLLLPLMILLLVGNGMITYYGFENYPRSERFKVIPEAGRYLQENCMDKKIYSNVYSYVWWYTHKVNHGIGEINYREKNVCVLYDFFYDDRYLNELDENLKSVFGKGKLKIYQN